MLRLITPPHLQSWIHRAYCPWQIESWEISCNCLIVYAFNVGYPKATDCSEFIFDLSRVERTIKAYSLNEWIDHKQDTKTTPWIEWLENAENKEITELFKYLIK